MTGNKRTSEQGVFVRHGNLVFIGIVMNPNFPTKSMSAETEKFPQ